MTATDPGLAQNALEVTLMAVRDGRAPLSALLETVMACDVFILLPEAPSDADMRSGNIHPLVLNNIDGKPLLAVFSSAERSVPMALQFPQFGTGLELSFRELLSGMQAELGLAMNPGTALGFEMPATNLARLREAQAG